MKQRRGRRSPRTTLREFERTAPPEHLRIYRVYEKFESAMVRYSRVRRPIGVGFWPDPRINAGQWEMIKRAALLIDELEADDAEFVEAQFDWFSRCLGALPTVYQLSTPAAVERYAEYKHTQHRGGPRKSATQVDSRYLERQVKKALRNGSKLEDVIRRGVLGGVLPEWFAEAQLGVMWKKKCLTAEDIDQLEGRR